MLCDSSDHELAFSQVCASWRRLGLADPTLWTIIDLSRPELVSLIMERAQHAPLSVTFDEDMTDEDTDFPFDLLPERNCNLFASRWVTQKMRRSK